MRIRSKYKGNIDVLGQGGVKIQNKIAYDVIENGPSLISQKQTVEGLYSIYMKNLDVVCSSADLILISLGRITRTLEPLFAAYPEMTTRLLRYFAVIDDTAVQIKNSAIKMKQLIDEFVSQYS
jgi:hypothetical protein